MFCEKCGKETEILNDVVGTHGERKSFCNKCVESSNISKCYNCDNKFEYNYKNHADDMCEPYCHECYIKYHIERSEEYDYLQLGWGYKPDPIFFGGNKEDENTLFMGIELETDDGDKDKTKNITNEVVNIGKIGYGMFWGKEDGSLSDYGIEFVSHPATLKYHKETEDWKKLLGYIKDAELKSNDCSNCGIHIHMNRSYLTTEQINKLDALVNLYSTTFRRFARRNSREYAIYNPEKTESHLGRNNNHDSRYSCLNFHNENTVEWRIFKGNTKYESIMALFELIQGTCDFVKQDDIDLPFIYGDKEVCKKAFKKFLEDQNFEYLPRYTEMCRVWRDLTE